MFNPSRRAMLLRSTVLALSSIPVQGAFAACSPYPVQPFTTTSCTNSNGGGLLINATGATLLIDSGADVSGGSQAALLVSVSATLSVAGAVNGGVNPGVLVTNGAPYFGFSDPYAGAAPVYGPYYGTIYPGTGATISVGASGTISGYHAIRLMKRSDNSSGIVFATIYNEGTLTGTGGAALIADAGTSFNTITNSATGTIGGISGTLYSFSNYGLIDGGSGGAVQTPATSGFLYNRGTIRSASLAATLDISNGSLGNEGLIANSGVGAAVAGTGDLYIENRAGGQITTAGGVAIQTAGRIDLINVGTIVGSVVSTTASGNSTVNTSAGTIDGDVLLGGGDDLFIGGPYDFANGRFVNVTGTVNGGGGIDSLSFAVGSDTTLGAVTLPTNFERFQIGLTNNATLELGDAFDLSHGISIGGQGTIGINRDAAATGPLVTSYFSYPTALGFISTQSLSAMLSNPTDYAINLQGLDSGQNSGTIIATGGGGLSLYSNFGAEGFTNSGTIIADGPAVTITGRLVNSGTIRSDNDVGVNNYLGGGTIRGITSTNSGTIEGRTAGVRLDSVNFINTGTITATAGLGVDLSYSAGFDNQAGGVVNGTVAAVGFANFGLNAFIQNAGTLNGDVNLVLQTGYDSSNDIFVDNGGTVNGDLLLGGGNDLFVTDLARTGTLAGVTGTVDAGEGYDVIRYRAGTDTSATISAPANFEGVGYELADGAAVTLTASGLQTLGLTFSGQGSVDLDADLSQTDHTIIDLGVLNVAQLAGVGTSMPSDLHIISRGILSLTAGPNYSYGVAAVNGATGTFENAGTIKITASPGGYYLPSAVFNASQVTNSGTITLDGAMAVSNVGKFVNTGLVTQVSGGAFSHGVAANQVDNSGIISVDGYAVTTGYNFGQRAVSNSGQIASRQGIGILASGGAIANAASGTISGHTYAIQNDFGGTIVNAGTINGNVLLGSSYYYSARGTYVADGGTLNGNLTLGSANDIVLALDGTTGITGTADAGAGTDLLGRFYRSDATTQIGGAIPATFEAELVEAVGAGTVVTLNSAAPVAADLWVAGDGQILNQASIDGKVTAFADRTVATDEIGVLASFTNDGTMGGGFEGPVSSFMNNGTIGSSTLSGYGVYQSVSGDLKFVNNGVVSSGATWAVVLNSSEASQFSAANAETINGAFWAGVTFSDSANSTATISNNGTVRSPGQIFGQAAFGIYAQGSAMPDTLSIDNTGLIEAKGAGGTAMSAHVESGSASFQFSITNGGTITANDGGILPGCSILIGGCTFFNQPASAVAIGGDTSIIANISNEASGMIEATGTYSVGVTSYGPSLNLVNAGTITGGPGGMQTISTFWGAYSFYLAGAITGSTENDIVTNSGTITGSTDLGFGNDSIENGGTITGDIFLRDGDDRFIQHLGASFVGTADGGDGIDNFDVDITGGGTLDSALYAQLVNFEQYGIVGSGTISTQGPLPVHTLLIDGAALTIDAGSTLQTQGPIAITGGAGSDQVVNNGTIIGDVVLGGGDDRFEVFDGSILTGSADGGTGSDWLALHLGGTPAAPNAIDFAPYSGFEQLLLESGTGTLAGSVSFDSIGVNGGRLIGLAGSTLTAPGGIIVAPDGTFGSAGAVNGSILVAGTLSPGASPATMTINGDLALASGSTTLFEMTPTLSDAIIINGALGIAAGATLDITGARPLTPGVTYDLIAASNGITGSFSTVNKAAAVVGFVRQTQSAIQLLGQFQLQPGSNGQVTATVNHVNNLLATGTAGAGLITTMPTLVNASGFADPALFARMNPEPYASASQIGIENGLALSAAVRSIEFSRGGEDAGLFGFGQGLGAWRRLPGDSAIGTSAANLHSSGFFGGIGFGSEEGGIGAFLGRIDARQRLGAMGGASNDADGTVFGMVGHAQLGGISLSMALARDASSGETTRAVPGGATAKGSYRLHGWTIDLNAGYRIDIGGKWSLRPELGLTYVESRRGRTSEQGAGVFALDVAGRTLGADFISGRLSFGANARQPVRPWVSMGVRHQLSGTGSTATASFAGNTATFAVDGVSRDDTLATVEGGVTADLSPSLALMLSGRTEFGADSSGESGNIGLRLRF